MRRIDAGTQRRLADAFARAPRAPASREVLGHGIFTLGFLAVAAAMAALVPAQRPFPAGIAFALVVALALAARVEFSTGACYTVPTQVVFVPLLLLVPAPYVPAL